MRWVVSEEVVASRRYRLGSLALSSFLRHSRAAPWSSPAGSISRPPGHSFCPRARRLARAPIVVRRMVPRCRASPSSRRRCRFGQVRRSSRSCCRTREGPRTSLPRWSTAEFGRTLDSSFRPLDRSSQRAQPRRGRPPRRRPTRHERLSRPTTVAPPPGANAPKTLASRGPGCGAVRLPVPRVRCAATRAAASAGLPVRRAARFFADRSRR